MLESAVSAFLAKPSLVETAIIHGRGLVSACATNEQGGEWRWLSAVQTSAVICLRLLMTTLESHVIRYVNGRTALSLALPLSKSAESADMSKSA